MNKEQLTNSLTTWLTNEKAGVPEPICRWRYNRIKKPSSLPEAWRNVIPDFKKIPVVFFTNEESEWCVLIPRCLINPMSNMSFCYEDTLTVSLPHFSEIVLNIRKIATQLPLLKLV
jgi:hypothetical protein